MAKIGFIDYQGDDKTKEQKDKENRNSVGIGHIHLR